MHGLVIKNTGSWYTVRTDEGLDVDCKIKGNFRLKGIRSTNPSLLILDEPFNFLDPSSQNILKKVLVEYNKQTGATILVSSHNLQHTIEISSRIALLEQGKIIKDLSNEGGCAEQELEAYFNV